MFWSTSASSASPRKILRIDCSVNQTWQWCRVRRLATIARFASVTPPASTSSKKVSTGSRISAGRSKRHDFTAMKLASVSPDKAAVGARIKAERAVAVIRTDAIERAHAAAQPVVAGGFRASELTYSFAGATDAIGKLTDANENDLLIGAGTILNRQQVHEAVGAGARFLVSPCVLPEVIDAAHDLQVAIVPGPFAPRELYTAHSLG